MRNKLGGLAFIKTVANRENGGRIVTCVEYIGDIQRGQFVEFDGVTYLIVVGGHHWVVESRYTPLKINDVLGYSFKRLYSDDLLEPIGTDDLDEDEDLYATNEDLIEA